MRLSARQSAIDVSSVHWPGAREKGPPPVMSVTRGKVPGGRNSTVVPSASPAARPRRAPRKREEASRDWRRGTRGLTSVGQEGLILSAGTVNEALDRADCQRNAVRRPRERR